MKSGFLAFFVHHGYDLIFIEMAKVALLAICCEVYKYESYDGKRS